MLYNSKDSVQYCLCLFFFIVMTTYMVHFSMSTKLIILSVNSIDDLSDSLYIDPVTKSTAKETEVFSNVMLSKAADRALAHGRDKITKNDIDEIALVCVPVVWPCI